MKGWVERRKRRAVEKAVEKVPKDSRNGFFSVGGEGEEDRVVKTPVRG
jgi:hypothetical protein